MIIDVRRLLSILILLAGISLLAAQPTSAAVAIQSQKVASETSAALQIPALKNASLITKCNTRLTFAGLSLRGAPAIPRDINGFINTTVPGTSRTVGNTAGDHLADNYSILSHGANEPIWSFVGESVAAKAAKSVERAAHANKIDGRPATLYEKYDKDGNFLKHGITKHEDPARRYTAKEINGGTVVRTDRGPRSEMIKKERDLVERNPGPDNRERWAGKKQNE